MDDAVEVGRVTIRLVSVPGDLLVHVDRTDGMSVLEAIGMLAMAQDTVLHEDEHEDEDD